MSTAPVNWTVYIDSPDLYVHSNPVYRTTNLNDLETNMNVVPVESPRFIITRFLVEFERVHLWIVRLLFDPRYRLPVEHGTALKSYPRLDLRCKLFY